MREAPRRDVLDTIAATVGQRAAQTVLDDLVARGYRIVTDPPREFVQARDTGSVMAAVTAGTFKFDYLGTTQFATERRDDDDGGAGGVLARI
jgi:hypothetical protein